MGWNDQIERHREALQGIVALLFALAALADRASGQSRHVRCEVLSILWPAEIAARELVILEAQASGMPMLALAACTFDDDARHLAARFRTLAIALAYILAQVFPPMSRHRVGDLPLSTFFRSNHATFQNRCARLGLGFRALDSPGSPF